MKYLFCSMIGMNGISRFARYVEELQKCRTTCFVHTVAHDWTVKIMDEYTERSEAFLSEYIQRGELLKRIDELVYIIDVPTEHNIGKRNGWIEGRGDAALVIITTPPADVAPVVHARWDYEDVGWICSHCHKDALEEGDYRQVRSNYCPFCGARMDGEEK